MFDKENYQFSATKISTWIECKRKFFWTYIAKVAREQNASASIGSATHKQLERYLEHGTPLDFHEELTIGARTVRPAEIAAAGLHLIPKPGTPGLSVEGHFKFVSPYTGFTYMGYRDWVVSRPIPEIGDHKTTSGLQWAKTAADLSEDVQAALYAVNELVKDPELPAVDLKWIYYQTKGPKEAKSVHLRMHRPQALKVFSAIELAAQEIADIVTVTKQVTDLAPSPEACGKYGGCPFQGLCNLSPTEGRFRGMNPNNVSGTNSLMDRLKERAAGGQVPAPPPTVPQGGLSAIAALRASRTPTKEFVIDEKKMTPGKGEPFTLMVDPSSDKPFLATLEVKAGEMTLSADWLTAPVDPGPGASMRSVGPATDMPINPVGEFQRAPTAEERAAQEAAEKATKAPKSTGTKVRRTKEEIAAGVTLEQKRAAAAETSEEGKTVALAVMPDPEDASPTIPAPADPVLEAHATELVHMGGTVITADVSPEDFKISAKCWTLYIDCLPLNQVHTTLASDLIARAHKELCAEMKVLDYRMIDYGRGAGLLSAGVATLAEGIGLDIYLDTRTPEGMACKEALAAKAAHVVQGIR